GKDIETIARRVAAVGHGNPKETTETRIEDVVNDTGLDKERNAASRKEYEVLVRTLTYRWNSLGESPEDFINYIDKVYYRWLLWHTAGMLVLQCALIMFFPGLLISTAFQAKSQVERRPQPRAGGFASFTEHVLYLRSQRFLKEESRALFWRRLGFAFLV